MGFKQSNIGEIIESERLMVLQAPERFGAFYNNAIETNYLLQHGVAGVPHHRSFFARWGSQIKKYHLLAVWSFVRLHQIQGLMSLRQVLEAAVDAAFAVAHPDNVEDYARVEKGVLVMPQSFKNKRYRWLAAHYKAGSDSIQGLKDDINNYGSHASVVQTMNNFEVQFDVPAPFFGTSFFDAEDAHHVKTDLWRAANVALCVLDLLWGVNRDFEVLTFTPDYLSRLQELIGQHEALGKEMRATERYQAAQRKSGDAMKRTG